MDFLPEEILLEIILHTARPPNLPSIMKHPYPDTVVTTLSSRGAYSAFYIDQGRKSHFYHLTKLRNLQTVSRAWYRLTLPFVWETIWITRGPGLINLSIFISRSKGLGALVKRLVIIHASARSYSADTLKHILVETPNVETIIGFDAWMLSAVPTMAQKPLHTLSCYRFQWTNESLYILSGLIALDIDLGSYELSLGVSDALPLALSQLHFPRLRYLALIFNPAIWSSVSTWSLPFLTSFWVKTSISSPSPLDMSKFSFHPYQHIISLFVGGDLSRVIPHSNPTPMPNLRFLRFESWHGAFNIKHWLSSLHRLQRVVFGLEGWGLLDHETMFRTNLTFLIGEDGMKHAPELKEVMVFSRYIHLITRFPRRDVKVLAWGYKTREDIDYF